MQTRPAALKASRQNEGRATGFGAYFRLDVCQCSLLGSGWPFCCAYVLVVHAEV